MMKLETRAARRLIAGRLFRLSFGCSRYPLKRGRLRHTGRVAGWRERCGDAFGRALAVRAIVAPGGQSDRNDADAQDKDLLHGVCFPSGVTKNPIWRRACPPGASITLGRSMTGGKPAALRVGR